MRKKYILKCTGFKKSYEINQLAIFPLKIQSSLETSILFAYDYYNFIAGIILKHMRQWKKCFMRQN